MLPCRFVPADLNQTVKGRKRFVDEVYIKKLEVDDINVESVVPDNIVCDTISSNSLNSVTVGVGVNGEVCSISNTAFDINCPIFSVHMNSGDLFEVINSSNVTRMLYSNGIYTEANDLRA